MGWIAAVSLLLKENFVWRQGFDLARGVDYLHAAFPSLPIGLYACGDNAALAALYAVAQRGGRCVHPGAGEIAHGIPGRQSHRSR